MAERKVLDRLLRLRAMEEDLSRLELEAVVGDRNRVAGERDDAIACHARGRCSLVAGIEQLDGAGRMGAVIEMEQASRWRAAVEPRLESAEAEVVRQREEFLARRTGRRQVETLVGQERAAALEEAGRRAQQMLDDWYGRRAAKGSRRERSAGKPTPDFPETGTKDG